MNTAQELPAENGRPALVVRFGRSATAGQCPPMSLPSSPVVVPADTPRFFRFARATWRYAK